MADNGRVAALDLALVHETTARGRVAALDLALVHETAARGRIAALDLGVIWHWSTPLPSVPDITGLALQLATFDASASLGSSGNSASITNRRWSWTSVPGGSTVANITPTPMPDSGGTTFIAMTSNAVLYHCEGSGADSSGNGNTATFSNVTTGAAGKVGTNAWSYDTAAGIATITTGVPLGADYTLAFWFFNLDPDTGYRAGFVTSPAASYPIIVEQTTKRLGVWTGGSLSPSGFIMNAADYTGWHHIVAVGTGTTTTFYVDGVLVGTSPVKVSVTIKTIGNAPAVSQRFAARLDEIAIWTRALTADEVNAIYANQSGNYAGTGTTFSFIPDVVGTYTVQYSQRDTNVAGAFNDSANAVITAVSDLGIWPMERLAQHPGIQGSSLRRRRGQM
jgi:hypothetical protein